MVKGKIIEVLKEGEKSASEISVKIGRNFYITLELLEELELENMIEKIEVGKHTIWRIKK